MYFYNYSKELAQLKNQNPKWNDSTYDNDICPSAEIYVSEYDVVVRISMDYENPDDREQPDSDRFYLSLWSAWSDPDNHSPNMDFISDLHSSNDMNTLLEWLWSVNGDNTIYETIQEAV